MFAARAPRTIYGGADPRRLDTWHGLGDLALELADPPRTLRRALDEAQARIDGGGDQENDDTRY